jgi:hypothetical protein
MPFISSDSYSPAQPAPASTQAAKRIYSFSGPDMQVSLFSLAACRVLRQPVVAHYRFASLIISSTVTSTYHYVRKNNSHNSPVSTTFTGLRCGSGAGSGASTQAATGTPRRPQGGVIQLATTPSLNLMPAH